MLKSFIGSRETIKDMIVVGDTVIVAGCDPVIHSFNIVDGGKK